MSIEGTLFMDFVLFYYSERECVKKMLSSSNIENTMCIKQRKAFQGPLGSVSSVGTNLFYSFKKSIFST